MGMLAYRHFAYSIQLFYHSTSFHYFTCLGPKIFAIFSLSEVFPFVEITVDLFLQKSIIFLVRPKKEICVFPVTRPTLFFPSDPKVIIGIPKKWNSIIRNLHYLLPFFIAFATFAVIFEAVLLFKHLIWLRFILLNAFTVGHPFCIVSK